MNVREFTASDMARVEELVGMQHFKEALPKINDPRCISRLAVTNGSNNGIAFGFLRVIGEGCLLLDNSWATPAFRWEALKLAHNALILDGVARGIDKAVTWIPLEIARPYGRRLESLGWDRQQRPSFTFEVSS